MSTERPHLHLGLAVLSLAAAVVFTGYEWFRGRAPGGEQPARRRENALAQLLAVPAPAVATKLADGAKERPPLSDRLQKLMKEADKGPGGVPLVRPEDLFVDHPALERTFLEAMRGRTWLKYGPFFAQAGLNTQEIESFCQAYADAETKWTELNKLAFQRGVPRSDPAIQAMEREASEERKTRLAALLGPERSAKLQQFQDEDGARQMLLGLNQLVATTYRSKEPVTAAQIDALVGITNEFHVYSPNEAAGIPGAFEQAEARARQVLTPDQMDIFNIMLDQQQVSALRYLEYRASREKQ